MYKDRYLTRDARKEICMADDFIFDYVKKKVKSNFSYYPLSLNKRVV